MRETYIEIHSGAIEQGCVRGYGGSVWVGSKDDVAAKLSKDGEFAYVFLGDDIPSVTAYMTPAQLAQLVSTALRVLPKELLDQVMDQHAEDLMDAESRAIEAAIPADVL